MAKEKKLTVSLRGQSLPSIYSTEALKLSETGAIIVYNHPVEVQVTEDDKLVTKTEYQTDSVAIRFAQSEETVSEENLRKLGASVGAIMSAYLGATADYSINNVIIGKLGYEFQYHKGMGIAITKIKLGEMTVSEAHYLGSTPKESAQPSQQLWALSPVPTALQKTVENALPVVIKKELYGG